MKKNLSTLCFAGLVALTGLVATGCGSDDTNVVPFTPTTSIHEYGIIANRGNNTFTIKNVNIGNGTSSVLNSQFATGVGTNPTLVKTHPNINVFYVLNVGSATISQYTMDANGGAAFLGTVATPANPQYMVIHPSGGFVYVGAASGGNGAVGSIRRFTVANNGTLTAAGADVASTSFFTNDTTRIKDADFSFGGGVLHSPEVGKIESFNIAADGSLSTTGAGPTLSGTTPEALDVDVRPGQASLVSIVRVAEATDRIESFPVNNGVVGAITTNLSSTSTFLNMADFAVNGQYYVGSASSPQMYGFNVDNATGALTALATNPMAVAAGNAVFVALDPSNNFILSTSAAADSILTARFRGTNGEFTGSTSDTQSLNNPAGFDFFTFNF
ncbi:MAG: beta-propeller fold lactonase family protein [Candidatus Eremiobacteraeota bacterium]|nr:beta-propeller fold lactonase family protein [Candidatus Eremiobacteraeota bacterium]